MAGILRIVGWLAVAVGVIFVILPMFTTTGLSTDAMVSSGIYLIIAGPLLIGLAKLIEVVEQIQANTNWLSAKGTPAAQATQATQAAEAVVETAKPADKPVDRAVERKSAPVPDPIPVPDPTPLPNPLAAKAPVADAVPVADGETEPAAEQRPAPMQAASQVRPPAPELYDASQHPAAIDEWSQNGRRIMTLEDGTYATEVDGAWYRFLELKDIEVLP